jgi:hypothetical protein
MSCMVDAAKGTRQRRVYRGILPELLQVEPDRGCPDISDSCLECPLPKCLWDYPYPERIKVKRAFIEAQQR